MPQLFFRLRAVVSFTSTVKDGSTRVERGVGFVSIYLDADSEPTIGELRSLGFAHTPLGTSLGYTSQQIVALPNDCHVVFWVENEEQLQQIGELLAKVDNVCPILMK